MLRRYLLVSSFVVFLLSSTRANANVVNIYQFTGDNGLSGSFTLDTTAGFTIGATDPLTGVVTAATSMSPLNQLTGLLPGPGGLFIFSGGNFLLTIASGDPLALIESSSWILRAGAAPGSNLPPFSSNTVGGLTVTGLNLFLNYFASCCVPPTFTPSFPSGGFFATQYGVTFSDGTTESATLRTLQLVGTTTVPEPTSLALLAIGLALLLGVFKRLEKGKGRSYPMVGQPIR